MTSGTWNRDDFQPYPTGGWTGTKWSRTWNGADYSASHVLNPADTSIFYATAQGRMIAAGLETTEKRKGAFPPPVLLRTPGLWNARPPKRARTEEHAYTVTDRRMTDELVTYDTKSVGQPVQVNTVPVNQFHAVPVWAAANLLTSNDQIRLVNRLGDKMKGSDFDMSVFLGEGHQACNLIAGAATRIAKGIRAVRRGQFNQAANELTGFDATRSKRTWATPIERRIKNEIDLARNVSSLWIELQYGWKPLLDDVVAGAQLLAHILNVPQVMSFKASIHVESLTERNAQWQYDTEIRKSHCDGYRDHRRIIIARVTESPSVPQLLGLTDPGAVAWELLPYSFVADWFIPIGEWISARELAGRLKGTFITSDKKRGTSLPVTSPWFDHQPRAWYTDLAFTRSISSTLKVPLPDFKPLSKAASWQHMANAVALVVSQSGNAAGGPGNPRPNYRPWD